MKTYTFTFREAATLLKCVADSIQSDEESISDYGIDYQLSDMEKTKFWYNRALLFEKLQPDM